MILFRYILKAHLIPFIFAVFTLMSVFLLNFFMKFADRLVGKGLGAWIIIKLVTFNLAWMMVLVVPMGVLIATLMAFGTMAQNNEIAILKASGVSLYKMLVPPLLGSILVAFLLMQFNNHVYPDANHAARLLGHDISRKKPTLSLVPGLFSQDIPKYSILARKINQEKNELHDITIYDKSNPQEVNIVTARIGKLYFSKNQIKLIMDLWNGEIHTSDRVNYDTYRKIVFDKHKIVMDADQFSFRQTTPGQMQRGEREMGAEAMIIIADSLQLIRGRYQKELDIKIRDNLFPDSLEANTQIAKSKRYIYLRVEDKLKAAHSSLRTSLRRLQFNKEKINMYWVEIHKKYAIPVACIVFILIGAPLGIMTRKGGIGIAAGISMFFFLLYWAFLIGGEKLSDRGMFSPFWGMWSANILLLILGIYLTVKIARERITIDFSGLQKLIPKQWRANREENEDN